MWFYIWVNVFGFARGYVRILSFLVSYDLGIFSRVRERPFDILTTRIYTVA